MNLTSRELTLIFTLWNNAQCMTIIYLSELLRHSLICFARSGTGKINPASDLLGVLAVCEEH